MEAFIALRAHVAVALFGDLATAGLTCEVEHGSFELIKRYVEPCHLTDESTVKRLATLYVRVLLGKVHE